MKNIMGMDAPARPLGRHTNHAANAIIKYKADQTGPNTPLGGVHEGLIKPAYQLGSEGVVKIEPTNAAPKHIPIHTPRPMSERVGFTITSESAEKGPTDYFGSVG